MQIQLGSYNDAYYAFSRAYELDKSNPQVLSSLTQLALLSGNIDTAEEHAQKLELLAPSHPAVKLTYGYVALRRADFDRADQQVDQLLAEFPREPSANLLKARILLGRGKSQEAIKLLETQTRGMPTDAGSWKALMALHERYRKLAGRDPRSDQAGQPQSEGCRSFVQSRRSGLPGEQHRNGRSGFRAVSDTRFSARAMLNPS